MSKQIDGSAEIEERNSAMVTNAAAIAAVSNAVEGTIGPKGLDVMLIDRQGEVIITNDGVTILEQMEVCHPAAQMLIHTAKAQQDEVGDGTTTAALLAGTLVSAGVRQISEGVPVQKVIEGMQQGIDKALEAMKLNARQICDLQDAILGKIAMVAGRGNSDIAELVVQAARLVGKEKLCEPRFRLAETVHAEENATNEAFLGVIVKAVPMNKEMPKRLRAVKVLVFDDALEIEEVIGEAMGTESGFQQYLKLKAEFKENLQKIVGLGVRLVLVDRNISADAEEFFVDAGILAVRRVAHHELERAAEHTGARMMKRTGIKKTAADIERSIGYASEVYEDEKLQYMRILGGGGKAMATVLVGAATKEVAGERRRIAMDAAASVQAAVRGGYVAGGGSAELAVAREVERAAEVVRGMSSYGMRCVVEALKRPVFQIVKNAGYHPLEKLEEITRAQAEQNTDCLGIHCDSGKICNMVAMGIVDPVLVKCHAVQAAGEIAVSILRIEKIIRGKNGICAVKNGAGDEF